MPGPSSGGASDPGPVWAGVLRAGSGASRQLRMLLEDLRLVSFVGDRAVLAASPAIRSVATSKSAEITDLFRRACGRGVRVVFEGDAPPAEEAEAEAATTARAGGGVAEPNAVGPAHEEPAPSGSNQIMDHPLIKEAIGLFGPRGGAGTKG